MRRTLLAAIGIMVACCYAGPLHATDVDGPNDCTRNNRDFGDAPEGTAVLAYPGVPGRFPTCITPGPAGTQTIACPPISTLPGATGFVMHTSVAGQPLYWLGCTAAGPPMGIDTETDGKVNNSAVLGAASACAGIPTDCVEAAFGLSFGQDECYGSTDAGVLKPTFKVCSPANVRFSVYNCTAVVQVYLNILVDMNHDGDWNDNFQCTGACAFEWAVKNALITLPVGCTAMTSPTFLMGPNPGQGWMRVTLSTNPVNNDFPWAGSATVPGGLQGGETEDYPVAIRKPVVGLLPADITWATLPGGTVRFHMVFRNEDPEEYSEPASGQIKSQQFGAHVPDFGMIGTFNVPALAPSSFFDVFIEIPLNQLPPTAQEVLPWGMMAAGGTDPKVQSTNGCPPDDHWDGNVDINWSSPSGSSQVNKHFGTLQVCPANGNSYIHTLVFCSSALGASWTITGVCPGWSATLVNEGPPGVPDGPAPNPVPPGWTGFICISANATVLPGATCSMQVTFTCDGVPGVIELDAKACDCLEQDPCTHGYEDWGDAPEGIPAYPSGIAGRFPTCAVPTAPGTQNLSPLCPPISTAPGPTGFVHHVVAPGDALGHFWLGCPSGLGPPGIDSEPDGKVNTPTVGVSACAGNPTDCIENGFGAMFFDQDECYGDGVDAGVVTPIVFDVCQSGSVKFDAFNCNTATVQAFLNVLVDLNHDGDWNDNFTCGGLAACSYEWAVKNVPIALPPGCTPITSPNFFVGPVPGPGWLRITVSVDPVPDDFPWNGSQGTPNQTLRGGETEDYPIQIRPTTTGVDDRLMPSEIRLGVQPNPSNGSVTVNLALPRESRVALAVYDITGRKLATLASGMLPAGEKAIAWNFRSDDGAEVPVGLYFVRADVDGRRYSQTLVRIQ